MQGYHTSPWTPTGQQSSMLNGTLDASGKFGQVQDAAAPFEPAAGEA